MSLFVHQLSKLISQLLKAIIKYLCFTAQSRNLAVKYPLIAVRTSLIAVRSSLIGVRSS